MSKTKIMGRKDTYEIELWTGIRNNVPLCCIMFYHSVWLPTIRHEIANYSKTMSILTENQGIILCPECIIKKISD